jgi:diguanylate cyclase (GGDEF)-like protein
VTYDPAQIFLGFFTAIGLYNGLVFVLTRERPFLWYTGIMASMVCFQIGLEPWPVHVLPPRLQYVYEGVTSFLYFGCIVGFARSFLRLPARRPALDRLLLALFALMTLAIALQHVLPYTRLHSVLEDVLLLGLLATCLVAGLSTMRSGDAAARYYVIGFACVMLGVAVEDIGLELHSISARYQNVWQSFYELGVAAEALFLALALAARVRSASVDQLTAVANRRAFDEALALAWHASQTRGTPFALVLIDLDDFKGYNDRLGHAAGDALLRAVARACADCTRDRVDTFARYGGDEFAAVLPRAASDEAAEVALRMQQAVSVTCAIGISAGVATTDTNPPSILAMIGEADAALYANKRARKRRKAAGELGVSNR